MMVVVARQGGLAAGASEHFAPSVRAEWIAKITGEDDRFLRGLFALHPSMRAKMDIKLRLVLSGGCVNAGLASLSVRPRCNPLHHYFDRGAWRVTGRLKLPGTYDLH